MEQKKIIYKEIIKLGFTEKIVEDTVYFNEFGFNYVIIKLKLTSKISIYWEKETQLCTMYRIDKKSKGNIMAKLKIQDLEDLQGAIRFFKK